jgi:hypothetical protein
MNHSWAGPSKSGPFRALIYTCFLSNGNWTRIEINFSLFGWKLEERWIKYIFNYIAIFCASFYFSVYSIATVTCSRLDCRRFFPFFFENNSIENKTDVQRSRNHRVVLKIVVWSSINEWKRYCCQRRKSVCVLKNINIILISELYPCFNRCYVRHINKR